jgi:hypothetical protein
MSTEAAISTPSNTDSHVVLAALLIPPLTQTPRLPHLSEKLRRANRMTSFGLFAQHNPTTTAVIDRTSELVLEEYAELPALTQY